MESNLEEQLTLFVGAIHASLSVEPGSESARKMTAISGRNLYELYEPFGLVGLLAKMLMVMYPWDSTKCYVIWKERVTPAGRLLFQLVPSAHTINETESGLLPTLTARDYKSDSCSEKFRKLRDSMTMGKTLPWVARGLLDPKWCEGFMGYPTGWTELKHSETQ